MIICRCSPLLFYRYVQKQIILKSNTNIIICFVKINNTYLKSYNILWCLRHRLSYTINFILTWSRRIWSVFSGCATVWDTTSSGRTARFYCSRAKRSAKPTRWPKVFATTCCFCTPDTIQNDWSKYERPLELIWIYNYINNFNNI